MSAVILAGDVLGAAVDPRAYYVMAVWFAIALAEGPWCAAAPDFHERRKRYALTLVFDCVMLGAAYYYLDAARIAGISAFLLIVVSARVVLPTRPAQALSTLVLAVYVALLVLAVRTDDPVASPVGLAPLTNKEAFLGASVVAAAAIVWLVLRMQAQVVRTVQDAESRHQAVVNAATDMILVVDDRGWINEVNAVTLSRTGYTWDELKELPNSTLFPANEWDRVLDLFRRALTGERLEAEVRVLTKEGRELLTESSLAPVVLEGRPAVVVVARDVTDRKRQADLLREQEARLDLVLNTLNSGFYTIDRNQVVTSVRGRGSGDSTVHRLVGKSITTIAPSPEQAVAQRDYHERALAGEVVTWVWPVGSGRWIRSHVAPLRDATGAVTGAAGFWQDETAIMRSREEADLRWSRFRAQP